MQNNKVYENTIPNVILYFIFFNFLFENAEKILKDMMKQWLKFG